MINFIKQLALLLLLSLFIASCTEESTSPEDEIKEGTFYKLGTVTFEFNGSTTIIEDFYIDGLTVMHWVGDNNPENSVVSALFKAKDSTTSVLIGLLGADISKNSLAGTYKVENSEATASLGWGNELGYNFNFTSGDMIVEKMERDGTIKLSIDGIGNYYDVLNPTESMMGQPAKLLIDAKLNTVYVNDVKQ